MLSLVRLLGVAALLAAPTLAGNNNHDSLRSNKRSHRQAANAVNAARDVQELEARELEERANGTENTLVKRAFTGRGTYFYVGLGACGQWSKDSDYMVALNSAQYGGGYPGPQCFKSITIQANGVTVGGVTIMDECPTCDWGGLDLSPGLFQRFAGLGAGVLDLTWWFDGDSGPAPSSEAPPPPAPSSSTDEWWTHTSTDQWWTHTSSTDQWWTHTSSSTPPASTAAASSTTSSTASSSSVAPTSSSSSVAPTSSTNNFVIQASASAAADVSVEISAHANNLAGLSGLVASYGQLIVVGAGGHVVGH